MIVAALDDETFFSIYFSFSIPLRVYRCQSTSKLSPLFSNCFPTPDEVQNGCTPNLNYQHTNLGTQHLAVAMVVVATGPRRQKADLSLEYLHEPQKCEARLLNSMARLVYIRTLGSFDHVLVVL
jgi:hypothetical protein